MLCHQTFLLLRDVAAVKSGWDLPLISSLMQIVTSVNPFARLSCSGTAREAWRSWNGNMPNQWSWELNSECLLTQKPFPRNSKHRRPKNPTNTDPVGRTRAPHDITGYMFVFSYHESFSALGGWWCNLIPDRDNHELIGQLGAFQHISALSPLGFHMNWIEDMIRYEYHWISAYIYILYRIYLIMCIYI